MTDPRIVGEFRDYDQLAALIRVRITELGITYQAVEEVAGIAIGYLGRAIQPRAMKGVNRVSMGPVFGALGIYGVLYVDEAAFAKIQHRLTPNKWTKARNAYETMLARDKPKRPKENPSRSQFAGNAKWGRMMALRLAVFKNPNFLQRRARKAAQARWKKQRLREKLNRALERKAKRKKPTPATGAPPVL